MRRKGKVGQSIKQGNARFRFAFDGRLHQCSIAP
jgi:hypothetical protein